MGDTAQNNDQELLDWLGLRLIPQVGSIRFAQLVSAFGSPGAALGAPLSRLERIPRLPKEVARAVHAKEFQRDPERELAAVHKLGARVITLTMEEAYPPLLRQVYAPPPVLYVRGDLTGCLEGGVGVVGSRAMSNYGHKVAYELGRDLGHGKVSVISGLARGVDTQAHQGALEAGGHTVGVLGCGVDKVYPGENRALFKEMVKRGAVVSEFPLGTPPSAGNFPVRNRVISGLSRAVVVVEAGLRSGALITARHALDQNREVLAVPGPVASAASQGCHELIKQGARLYSGSHDLLGPGSLPPGPGSGPPPPPADLPPEAEQLLDLMGPTPMHLDELVRGSGLAAQEVTALLVDLELAGLVAQQPGKHYVLI